MVGGKWPFELKPAFYEPERFLREQAEVEVALMVPRRSGERGGGGSGYPNGPDVRGAPGGEQDPRHGQPGLNPRR